MKTFLCIFVAVVGVAGQDVSEYKPYQAMDTRSPVNITDQPYIADLDVCTGTIVSEQWILTAAHCAYDKFSGAYVPIRTARVGSSLGDAGRRVDVEYAVEHPKFDLYNSIQYDFLLLKLFTPLKFGPRVRAARLAGSYPRDLVPGVTCSVLGFGHEFDDDDGSGAAPKRLMSEQVTLISFEECRTSYEDVDLHGFAVCARAEENYCEESGGPLILDGSVIGVASSVNEHKCSSSDPIPFASVPLVRNWIRYYVKFDRAPSYTTRYPFYATQYPSYTTQYPIYTTQSPYPTTDLPWDYWNYT